MARSLRKLLRGDLRQAATGLFESVIDERRDAVPFHDPNEQLPVGHLGRRFANAFLVGFEQRPAAAGECQQELRAEPVRASRDGQGSTIDGRVIVAA